MSKRRPLVAGNWKMHGTQADAAALVNGIKQGLADVKAAEVAVCPPFILIPLVSALLKGVAVAWGGQNLSVHKSGAYTGEIRRRPGRGPDSHFVRRRDARRARGQPDRGRGRAQSRCRGDDARDRRA